MLDFIIWCVILAIAVGVGYFVIQLALAIVFLIIAGIASLFDKG
jgi:hypothetical protein